MTDPAGLRAADLLAAMPPSWPARESRVEAGLILRDDAPAAGSRVRSALPEAPLAGEGAALTGAEAEAAAGALERYYRERTGPALLQAAREDAAELTGPAPASPLETALEARGFAPFDPCLFVSGECETLAAAPAPEGVRVLSIAAPVAALERLWEAGEIGPERRAVMARAIAADGSGLARVIAARIADRIQGAAFLAPGAGGVAFMHALYVSSSVRRRGAGAALIRFAAALSREAGRPTLAAATRVGSTAARALFRRAGMREQGGYLYWRKDLSP